jgi:microsomal dipeptidase-like Zn-dependent dipeptidase
MLINKIKIKSICSRRDFFAAAATMGAGMAFVPFSGWAADEMDPKVVSIVASTIGIDTHNHIDVPLTAADVPGPDLDLVGEMKRSGLSAICATFAVDYQRLGQPGVAYERFQSALASMEVQLARNHMRRALTLKDLQTAHQQGQPTVIQAVEGGHFLEGHLDRLGVAYQQGLRVLGLLHDSDASVPLGDIYTNPPHWGGLTEFGASVVRECNRLGILIDLTHSSADTVAAALKISTQPMAFTHTGLDTRLGNNPSMGQMMRPRLISKEHAKVIADAGGVVGIWTHLVDSPAEYVQAVRAMADVVGIDHVCIGTDTKLTPPARFGGFGGPGGPGGPGGGPNSGPGGPGTGQIGVPNGFGGPDGGTNRVGRPDGDRRGPGPGGGRPRVGERTNQVWADQKVGFYFAVVAEMVKQGFTAEEIGKVGGGNFCRAFDAATAGHA